MTNPGAYHLGSAEPQTGVTRRRILTNASVAVAAMTTLEAERAVAAGADPAPEPAGASLSQTAQDAVIFGFPALLQAHYLQRTRTYGVRDNHLYLADRLATAATKAPGQNDDTMYGLAWFDLSEGPQVIEVPPCRGRYYLLQLIDMWTNNFADIGSEATGERGGAFVLTPPGWTGALPRGARQIKAPTTRVQCFPRTFVNDAADLDAANAFQERWTTGPLTRFPHGRIKSRLVHEVTALNAIAPIDLSDSTISLYEQINQLILEYPPLPEDAADARRLRAVGVGVDHYQHPGSKLAGVLKQAIKPALNAIAAEQKALFVDVNGWTVDYQVKPIIHNPLERAANTIDGPGLQLPSEALYFTLSMLDGAQLTGTRDYTLVFPDGDLPPVHAFWSLIMYGEHSQFVANPINRYEVASHGEPLVFGSDGSLTIAIQHAQPTATDVNWLPAPSGAFQLILRTYVPQRSIRDGSWRPPAVTQTG